MGKKDRPINILWIDDKPEKLTEFKAVLRSHRIITKGFYTNSQEGMADLQENGYKYEAIILDAIALRNADDTEGTESIKSLRDSINKIGQISRDQKRKIPFCIYTGYKDSLGEAWEDDLFVFRKGLDQKELIEFIRTEVEKLPESQAIIKYLDVFEIFDEGNLDLRYKNLLIRVIQSQDTRERNEISEMLTNCRKILEGLYKKLGEIGRIHPELFYSSGLPNLGWCLRYLEGNKIDELNDEVPPRFIPEYLGLTIKLIINITSAQGAHDMESPPTNYTLKSTLYGVFELLVWLNKVILKQNH